MADFRPKILFCMHMPPPVHGAAVVGKQIYESDVIRDSFDCSYINASTSTSLDDVGRFSFAKVARTCDFYRQVLKAVKDKRPDVVYFTPSTSGWAFYRDAITICLLRHRGQNVVLHFHNKPTDAFLLKWYNKRVWKCFFDGVSAIFLGEALAKQFDKYTPICRKVYICPNGMPDEAGNTPVARRTSERGRPYTFLFLSNMIETKGVYVLLDACALLKQKGYDFRCEFVGQWFDITRDAFEAKCVKLDISDCAYAYGAKYGEEKNDFLISADAFVFPTYYPSECFPLVLIEAMQYSLPAISTPEGGIMDVLDSKVGFLVPQRDSKLLADRMQFFIEHPHIGLEMGKNGRLKYECMYNLHIFEQRLKMIFLETISEQ